MKPSKPSSPPIKCLSITFCRIDESMLRELIDALLNLKTLHSLQLSFTSAGSKGATYCAKLITHSSLKNLVLSGNYFGDKGTQVLAAALPTCSLEHLNLSHNLITELGLHAIAKEVERHPTLKTINLSFNPFMSAPLFHAALRSTQSLSEIPLNRTLSVEAAFKISQLSEQKHFPRFLL
ncbi:MAG: hypothetical protein KDK65_06415 [Chlamydiia bacterium]|nr:hypothetical protein [Chlamydiia bacterium]